MTRITSNALLAALLSLFTLSAVTRADDAIFSPGADGPWNQPVVAAGGVRDPGLPSPTPGNAVPPGATPNGDMKDPSLMIPPAPAYELQGGYMATIDKNGANSGGGIGVALFMDGGRTGILINGQVAGTQGGVIAGGQAKIQYRIPIDPGHIIWGGIGLDVKGQGGSDPKVAGYFSAELPTAFIGTMFAVGNTCVIHLFAKAAFDIYDSQTQGDSRWVKPAVGAEALAACGTIRVTADYEHVFAYGGNAGTERAEVNMSQLWMVNKAATIQLGYFIKGDIDHEGPAAGASGDGRTYGGVFGGIEMRYGANGKAK